MFSAQIKKTSGTDNEPTLAQNAGVFFFNTIVYEKYEKEFERKELKEFEMWSWPCKHNAKLFELCTYKNQDLAITEWNYPNAPILKLKANRILQEEREK